MGRNNTSEKTNKNQWREENLKEGIKKSLSGIPNNRVAKENKLCLRTLKRRVGYVKDGMPIEIACKKGDRKFLETMISKVGTRKNKQILTNDTTTNKIPAVGTTTNKTRNDVIRKPCIESSIKYCSLPHCFTNSNSNPNLSFFRMPDDDQSTVIWVKQCGNVEWLQSSKLQFLKKHTLICSLHFEDYMFTDSTKQHLKDNAYPCIMTFKENDPLDVGEDPLALEANYPHGAETPSQKTTSMTAQTPTSPPASDIRNKELFEKSESPLCSVCSVGTCSKLCLPGNKLCIHCKRLSFRKCAIENCEVYIRTLANPKNYLTFPKNAKMRAKWIKAIGKPENWNADNCFICLFHFHKQTDFIKRPGGLLELKPEAVPSLNIKSQTTDNVSKQNPEQGTQNNKTVNPQQGTTQKEVTTVSPPGQTNSNNDSTINCTEIPSTPITRSNPPIRKTERLKRRREMLTYLKLKRELIIKRIKLQNINLKLQNHKLSLECRQLLNDATKNSTRKMDETIQLVEID